MKQLFIILGQGEASMADKSTKRILLLLASLLLPPLATLHAADAPRPAKPNLVLIMADDLGYETIGANGGTSYQTPELDRHRQTGHKARLARHPRQHAASVRW